MSKAFAFDAYVIDQQEKQEKLMAWSEYRTHGGLLDFTQWEEREEQRS